MIISLRLCKLELSWFLTAALCLKKCCSVWRDVVSWTQRLSDRRETGCEGSCGFDWSSCKSARLLSSRFERKERMWRYQQGGKQADSLVVSLSAAEPIICLGPSVLSNDGAKHRQSRALTAGEELFLSMAGKLWGMYGQQDITKPGNAKKKKKIFSRHTSINTHIHRSCWVSPNRQTHVGALRMW